MYPDGIFQVHISGPYISRWTYFSSYIRPTVFGRICLAGYIWLKSGHIYIYIHVQIYLSVDSIFWLVFIRYTPDVFVCSVRKELQIDIGNCSDQTVPGLPGCPSPRIHTLTRLSPGVPGGSPGIPEGPSSSSKLCHELWPEPVSRPVCRKRDGTLDSACWAPESTWCTPETAW